MSIRDQIIQLTRGNDLTQEQAAAAMEEIMTGVATPAQIAAFLTALHLKGETEAEIAGMAEVMRAKATHVHYDGPLLDTAGTGGDRSCSINVSTLAAFVAAGAGVRVAKHGNRSATSACGSADLLETLGVAVELGPAGVSPLARRAMAKPAICDGAARPSRIVASAPPASSAVSSSPRMSLARTAAQNDTSETVDIGAERTAANRSGRVKTSSAPYASLVRRCGGAGGGPGGVPAR